MNLFSQLRVWVHLKRISQALEKANEIAQARLDLERERLALDHPRWYKAGGKLPETPKMSYIDKADPAEWEQSYKERHPNNG